MVDQEKEPTLPTKNNQSTSKPVALILLVFLLVAAGLLVFISKKNNQILKDKFPALQKNTEKKSLNEDEIPKGQAYWSHYDLPELTMAQRLQKSREAKRDPEKYYQESMATAEAFSKKLEDHIYSWLKAELTAKLPQGFLPAYIDSPKSKDWTLQKPEEVIPENQWYTVPAHRVDPEYKKLYMLGVDSHVTYHKLIFLAPFGSKLLIEGDFPYARFMDFQILQPFDPSRPASGAMGEQPEVPLVDADIEPDQGSINPFRVGANRKASQRHYHITFDLQAGNSVDLNPEAMQPPAYRAGGNKRVGGPFGFAGPWGDNVLVPSVLIMRIYAPDRDKTPLGGVAYPKALLELPTGEKYWLQSDFSLAKERQNTRVPAGLDTSQEPIKCLGADFGWLKIFGLILVRQELRGYLTSTPCGDQEESTIRSRTRQANSLLFNRGINEVPPGNFQASATTANYNTYLTRVLMKGEGKIYVITGKLPTTPKTRNGEEMMTAAQARYWSISRGGKGESDLYETSVHYGSLMDDEILTDKDNNYIIVYSTKEDRPVNAVEENLITWQDWGPRSRQSITVRWMSVPPEWYLPEYAPDETNIPWSTGAWSEDTYDRTLIGENKPGVLGSYHPVIYYMTKAEFEALGNTITAQTLPKWE